MFALTQSPFLQALGYAITNSLWQFALLWLLYILITGIAKPMAQHRYRLALFFQLAGFIWFLFTLHFYYIRCSEALATASALGLSGADLTNVMVLDKGWYKVLIYAEQVLPYLAVAYLMMMLVLLMRWVKAYQFTAMIRHQGLQKIPVDWRLFTNRIAAHLGIKQTVKIYLSDLVKSPLTIGFLKPMILIPAASMNHLTVQQLEAVILHELAHIRRFDYLINILVSIAELMLFFNPFTQLLSQQIKNEREHACDDWVLQFQYDGAMYAEALLRLATVQQSTLTLHVANKKNDLLQRVRRVVGQPDKRFSYRQQLLALLMVTCILSAVAWLSPVNVVTNVSASEPSKITISKKVFVQPVAASVDNPLFNPIFFLNNESQQQIKEELQQVAAATAAKNIQFNEGLMKDVEVSMESELTKATTALLASREDMEPLLLNAANQSNRLQTIDSMAMAQLARLVNNKSITNLELQQLNKDLQQSFAKLESNAKQLGFAMLSEDKKMKETIAKSMAMMKQAATSSKDEAALKTLIGKLFTKAQKMKVQAIKDSIEQHKQKLVKAPTIPAAPIVVPGFAYNFAGSAAIPLPVFSFETKEDVKTRYRTKQYQEQKLPSPTATEEKIEVIISVPSKATDSTKKKKVIIFL